MSEDLVAKSFKSCGISVALDGSEDTDISVFKPDHGCEEGLELLKTRGDILSQELEVDEEEELRLMQDSDDDDDEVTEDEEENE